ncbi:MAG TPA: lamin tail domain-containing protein, partial [Verrucomicrobiota bacterium]|nr:lamin tail domain-containing protein [Verrucomicrobiota bacterium]
TLYEDAQQPNRSVVSQFYPNDDAGSLHKIEDWFEFDSSGDNKLGNVDATLQDFTTTGGVKKTARYRWILRPRAVRESANNFTNLFALVDAVNAPQPEPYRSRVATIMNVEEWMRILAMERIVGNWDSYGYWRGKNMYAYKPENGPWVLLPWDIDFVFHVGGSGATDGLFGSNAPLLDRLRDFPEFQRAYWRAFEDAASGPLKAATFAARVDKVYNGLAAQGISVALPQGLKDYAAARRNYIISQLATVAASFAVTGPSSFSTNQNLITVRGTAPVTVARLTVNGVTAVPTWTSVTQWTLRVALQPGLNNLVIQGWDNKGQTIGGATASLAITYTGAIEPPEQHIVINELMYHPVVPDAEFIELHSTASSTAYDLSNWRINGLDCTIPPATILAPGGFLVFVKKADVFSRTYGSSIPIAGTFDGSFDHGGETVSLVQPGATPEQDVIIDQVTFDDDPPWPTVADGTGPSLQLIDPQQDNNRVANWGVSAVVSNPPPSQVLLTWTNTWRYNQTANLDGVNWTSPSYDDSSWPAGQGVLADEDCNCLPQPIRTALADNSGRMTFYFRTTFNYTGSLQGVQLRLTTILDDGAIVYLNGRAILRIGMPEGTPEYSTPASRTVTDANYEGPFTVSGTDLVTGINVLAVEVHQNNSGSSDLVWALHLETDFSQTSQSIYTPGAPNSVRDTLAPFPTVWLNEVLPLNSHYITNAVADRMGDFDPWVELFNGGTNTVSLNGFYLATNYAQPTLWPFPATASLAPGEFRIVWLDGEPTESTANEWHTSFRLPAGEGALALTYSTGGTNKILDYLHYNIATVGRAFGSCPDANVSARRLLTVPTPGAPNNPASLPIHVFINEWMADNVATLADPADGDYEDWFEVYNPGDVTVDLGGYYFTDNLDVKLQFRVPANGQYVVPPHGYLLLWADNECDQNSTSQPDLHVNFALAKTGETIGLFGHDGTLIDAVTFGLQIADASEGRSPDGSANVVRLSRPSPRAPNSLSQTNTPPVLDPIPNRVIGEGSLLTFTATATDTDVPRKLSLSHWPKERQPERPSPPTGCSRGPPANRKAPAFMKSLSASQTTASHR